MPRKKPADPHRVPESERDVYERDTFASSPAHNPKEDTKNFPISDNYARGMCHSSGTTSAPPSYEQCVAGRDTEIADEELILASQQVERRDVAYQ